MAEEDDGRQTKELLEALDCPLCCSRFTNPKLTDCGHTFCQTCLENHLRCHGNSNGNCPVCHRHIALPEKGVAGLPTQHFYQDLVKTIIRLESDNKISRGSCKFCSDDNKNLATVKCIACQVLMCEKCSSNHVHNGVTNVIPVHRKQDSLLREMLPNRDTACPLHSPEPLLLYCIECRMPICFKCKDEAHTTHAVDDLADAVVPGKAAIEDTQAKVKAYLGETRDALDDVEKIKTEYEAKVRATKQQIESQVQKLIDHLQKEKQKLLDELAQKNDDIQKRLQKEQKDFESKRACAKSMNELSDNLLKYGTDAEVASYRNYLEKTWRTISDDNLNRFGQGYRVGVQFFLRDGLPDVLSREIGELKFTQTLSPWASRKHTIPFTQVSDTLNVTDPNELQMRIKRAMSNDFSQKRSEIFSRFVDPKWTLETYKTSAKTGHIVTAWLKSDEDSEQQSRSSKRISMRSISLPTLTAEVCSYNEKGTLQYQNKIEKLPDGSMIRIAIADTSRIILAAYPGAYISSVIGMSKRKTSSKKRDDVEGIYVAIYEKGNFICGELRKIPIPEGPGFDFDISTRGTIAVKAMTCADIKVYPTTGGPAVTDHGEHGMSVLRIMESPDNDIVAVSKDHEENMVCEVIHPDGSRETRFKVSTHLVGNLFCKFKDACFDRNCNLLFRFSLGSEDLLYLASDKENRREFLSKPEMIHKVERVAPLPDGRLCVFDRTEYILMALKYI